MRVLPLLIIALALILGVPAGPAIADSGHDHGAPQGGDMLNQMKEMHKGHDHAHDFEAMEEVSPEDTKRILDLMADIGLVLPPMDSVRGRQLFLDKGCVACHVVNGVGGEIGPSLNAADMPSPMNAFEFSARMWRGAPAMAEMQSEMLGEAISLSGQDLADLVAFAHDETAQKELKTADIPPEIRKLMTQ